MVGFKFDEKCFLFYAKNSFSFSRYSDFSPDFLGHVRKRLDKKAKFISKFMTSETGKQKITNHILPNTSRMKRNQTMKFTRIIEYSMRNVFLEIIHKICWGKLVPDLFIKNQN